MKVMEKKQALENEALRLLSEAADVMDDHGRFVEGGEAKFNKAQALIEEIKGLEEPARREQRREALRFRLGVAAVLTAILSASIVLFSHVL